MPIHSHLYDSELIPWNPEFGRQIYREIQQNDSAFRWPATLDYFEDVDVTNGFITISDLYTYAFEGEFGYSQYTQTDEGNLCGSLTFYTKKSKFSFVEEQGEEVQGIDFSSHLSLVFSSVYDEVAEVTRSYVKVAEEVHSDVVGDGEEPIRKVRTATGGDWIWKKPEDPNEDEYYDQVVGNFSLSDEVTTGSLTSTAKQWLGQGLEFIQRTVGKTSGWPGCSGSPSGRFAVVTAGYGAPSADMTQPVDHTNSGLTYKPYLPSFKARISYRKRRNIPVLYRGNNRVASGNEIYRNGSVEILLSDPITTKIWRDDFGIYDVDSSAAWTGIGWVPARIEDHYNPAQGMLYPEGGGAGRLRLASADGRSYRATVDAGKYDDSGAWQNVGTEVVQITATAPGIITFPGLATAVAALVDGNSQRPAYYYVQQFRVSRIELMESGGSTVLPTTPAQIDQMIDLSPGSGVILLAAAQARGGRGYYGRWGFKALDDSDAYYATKTLTKKAAGVSKRDDDPGRAAGDNKKNAEPAENSVANPPIELGAPPPVDPPSGTPAQLPTRPPPVGPPYFPPVGPPYFPPVGPPYSPPVEPPVSSGSYPPYIPA